MVTIYVEAILGLLLLFAWAQNTQIHAVAWWGFAHLIRAGSIVLFGMYGTAPDLITIDFANALLFTAFAVTWTGARVFDGRPVEPVYLVTGAVIWLLVCRLPILAEAIDIRSMIASAIITAYTWLTAYEFWRGRSEQLVLRWPAIFMLFAMGRCSAHAAGDAAALVAPIWRRRLFVVLSFGRLIRSLRFILLGWRERTELRHRTAAMIDPLTGISNRRPFCMIRADGERLAPSAADRPAVDRSIVSVDQRPLRSYARRPCSKSSPKPRSSRSATVSSGASTRRVRRGFVRHQPDKAVARVGRIREASVVAQTSTAVGLRGRASGGALRGACSATKLLAHADQALHFAKENGSNALGRRASYGACARSTSMRPPETPLPAPFAQSAA